jgi:hypothetical protein
MFLGSIFGATSESVGQLFLVLPLWFCVFKASDPSNLVASYSDVSIQRTESRLSYNLDK